MGKIDAVTTDAYVWASKWLHLAFPFPAEGTLFIVRDVGGLIHARELR
jgi:hypothetical protein